MFDSLKDKRCLITGASRNIGEAVARLFAEKGAKLVLHALHEESVARVVQSIKGKFPDLYVDSFFCDIRDRDTFDSCMDKAIRNIGGIDILVNNAGGSAGLIGKLSRFVDAEPSTLDFVVDLNLKGTMWAIKSVLPGMIGQGYGRIINIASIAGEVGIVDRVDYSAAKGGVIAMTKALAMEVGRYGITVNAISPGAIERGGVRSKGMTFIGEEGRSGAPHEVASMVLYLASDAAGFITGQDYAVDGGRTLGPIIQPRIINAPITGERLIKGVCLRASNLFKRGVR